jgi:hypothetical protein
MRKDLFLFSIFYFLFFHFVLASPLDDISQAVFYLGKINQITIDKGELSHDIVTFNSKDERYGLEKAIIKAARRQGLYLNGFRLREKGDILLFSQNDYFIAKYKGVFSLCRMLNDKVEMIENNKKLFISEKEFLKNFSDPILSLPIMNVLLERLDSQPEIKGRFIVAYSYHKEKFEKFREFFDKLYQQAKEKNYKIIYVDELGLIPENSIEKVVKREGISEKKAFQDAKKRLLQDLKLIEKGIPTYDKNKYYYKIYSYLAKYKINVDMENLNYEDWRAIVAFDDLNLNQLAISLFSRSYLDRYLNVAKQYSDGFWQYNVHLRDRIFTKQIGDILDRNSNCIIFTLRGLGHYGMEENFKHDGYTTEVIIFGEGKFSKILVSDQLIQIYKRNGVFVSKGKEKLSYLKAFPQECVRSYLQKELGENLSLATYEAVELTKDLKEEEIKRLSLDLSHALYQGRLRSADKIYEFVYNWVKAKLSSLGKKIEITIP